MEISFKENLKPSFGKFFKVSKECECFYDEKK